MYTTLHAAIIINQPIGAGRRPEVHLYGDLQASSIDLALDEVRRIIGTYEETPLDRFVQAEGLKLEVWTNRDGTFHAFIEASLREPGTTWGLMGCSADGATPAAARRNLAARMSGGTLVRGAMLPNPRYVGIPDLTAGPERESDGMSEV